MPGGRLPYLAVIAVLILSGRSVASAELRAVGGPEAGPVVEDTTYDGLTGFILQLKPIAIEGASGFAEAVDRAAGWVHGLEPGWSGPEGGAARSALLRGTDNGGIAASAGAPPVSLLAKNDYDASASVINTDAWRTIQGLSLATMAPYDRTWVLHPQPSAGLLSGTSTTNIFVTRPEETASPIGSAVAEQSFTGHDIEVGVPLSPWMKVSGSRYWWGAQDITPEVRGSRVGVTLTPVPFVEIEGGRMQDTERANGSFISARLSFPLGQP